MNTATRKLRIIKTISLVLFFSLTVVSFAGCSKTSSVSTFTSTNVRTIYVGTGNDMAPYCYLDSKNKLSGYEIDFINELGKKLPQYKFEFKVMSFDSLAVSLQTGKLDIAVHQFVKNAKREKNFLIPTAIYCISPLRIAVKKDSSIVTLNDLRGKTIIMDPSSFEYGYVKEFSDKDTNNPIKIQESNGGFSDADILKKVASGEIDADLTYPTEFNTIQDQIHLDLKLTNSVVLKENTYPLIAKKDTQLLKDVNDQIVKFRKDGTLSKLSKKWFKEDVFSE